MLIWVVWKLGGLKLHKASKSEDFQKLMVLKDFRRALSNGSIPLRAFFVVCRLQYSMQALGFVSSWFILAHYKFTDDKRGDLDTSKCNDSCTCQSYFVPEERIAHWPTRWNCSIITTLFLFSEVRYQNTRFHMWDAVAHLSNLSNPLNMYHFLLLRL